MLSILVKCCHVFCQVKPSCANKQQARRQKQLHDRTLYLKDSWYAVGGYTALCVPPVSLLHTDEIQLYLSLPASRPAQASGVYVGLHLVSGPHACC